MKSVAAIAAALLLSAAATAQAPAGSAPRASVSKDPASAPAGLYRLDPRHSSVIVKVGHGGGVSYSTFRFDTAAGELTWDAARPEASRLSVTVNMTSLSSAVPGFASELIGDKFLKTAQFGESKFVSTSIQRTGPTTGKITGNLTFMGVTKPIVIDASLVGAGAGRSGPVVGFTGEGRFKRSDFEFTTMVGPIGDEIILLVDVEFTKAA